MTPNSSDDRKVTGVGDPAAPPFRRLVGQVVAVGDLDAAVADFQRCGFTLSDRSARPEWEIDTATFGFRDGCYLELVTSTGRSHEIGRTVGSFLDRRGEGLYMTTIEVPDVADVFDALGGLDGGIVAAEPAAAPPDRGIPCDLLWIRPSRFAGAFVQLLSYRDGPFVEDAVTPGMRGLFNQAIAVSDIERAVADVERLGQRVSDRSSRADWGLDTATFHLGPESSIEFVAPRDRGRPTGGAVGAFLDRTGGGHYMTVFEVDDVEDLYRSYQASGVRTLGPPTRTPPESPWPPADQFWIHPAVTHGAFIEFLTLV